jgi:hypothetical protein
MSGKIDLAMKFLSVLTEEIEQLRSDAERYRWLRVGDNDELVLMRLFNPNTGMEDGSAYIPRNKALDAIIDRRMKRERAAIEGAPRDSFWTSLGEKFLNGVDGIE